MQNVVCMMQESESLPCKMWKINKGDKVCSEFQRESAQNVKLPNVSGKMVKSDTMNNRLQRTSLASERLFSISRAGIKFLVSIPSCCMWCSHTLLT